MQFQVPQFIDISPKIVGPLTLKQFLFLAAAAVPLFILFFILNFWVWIFVAVVLGSIGAALAFAKINGQPAVKIGVAAFNYFWQPRFFVWRRTEAAPKLPSLPKIPKEEKANTSPLKDLLLKITTSTHPIAKREKPTKSLGSFVATEEDFETLRKTTGDRETARRVDYR
jgi:hypothetical protein